MWSFLYVKEHFLPAIPQSSHKNILPCFVRYIDFPLKFIFIDWSMGSIWTYLQALLPHCLCLSLSPSCASLKCNHLVCIWGCGPQNLSLHKHSEWVYLSPSIHISCRSHLWILVYSVVLLFLRQEWEKVINCIAYLISDCVHVDAIHASHALLYSVLSGASSLKLEYCTAILLLNF